MKLIDKQIINYSKILIIIYLIIFPAQTYQKLNLNQVERIKLQNQFKLNLLNKNPIKQNQVRNYKKLLQNATSFLQSQLKSQVQAQQKQKIATESDLISLSKQGLNQDQKQKWYKKIQRKTTDGRNCQSSFVYRNVLYDNCIAIQDPAGKTTGQEWCYTVETGTPTNWQYCNPILDFDEIRKYAVWQKQYPRIIQMRLIIDQMSIQQQQVIKTINTFTNTNFQQNLLIPRVKAQDDQLKALKKDWALILQMRSQWEVLEKKIKILKGEIEALKKLDLSNNPANCEGLQGYEEESDGDGLVGQYYDNELFMGNPQEKRDPDVNLNWSGEVPVPSLNSDNFSGVWTSFLKIPVTAEYQFRSMADDGHEVSINDNIIISHKMVGINRAMESNGTLVGSYLMNEQEKSQQVGLDRTKQGATSEKIKLIGGTKYEIKLKYFHTVHSSFKQEPDSYFKLYWSSEQFSEQIIKETKFYTKNLLPPLKLYGYSSDVMQLNQFLNFNDPFKDSKDLKIADIPQQFEGLQLLQLDKDFYNTKLNFSTTAPVTIFMAVHAKETSPLDETWLDTQEVISLLKIPIINEKTSPARPVIKAKASYPFKIYKRNFPIGTHQIPLKEIVKKSPTQTNFYRLIPFFQPDVQGTKQVSCGGQEQLLSLNTGKFFDGCTSSSNYPGGQYDCQYAFSNKMKDEQFGMWATNGEGTGSYIEIKLKSDSQITKIKYLNRGNSMERNRQMTVLFSNGFSQTLEIKNTFNEQTFMIQPQVAKTVRFTITGVYGTLNNGGAFNIYGLACKSDKASTAAVDQAQEQETLKLGCQDTMSNNDQIIKRNLKEGQTMKIQCNEPCVQALDNVQIFGTINYSEDSSICKAAAHMGVLSQLAPEPILVKVSAGQAKYEQSTQNGITSNFKEIQSAKSITFIKIVDEQIAELDYIFVGMKVDYNDQKFGKWVEATVEKLNRISQRSLEVEISMDGQGQSFNKKVNWGNLDKIDFCGEKIQDRKCDSKSQRQKQSGQSANLYADLKICFTPKETCKEGYMVDNGKSFQQKGDLKYGWSRDVSMMTRTRYLHNDELFDNLILFPADVKSQWCKTNNPKVPCSPAIWTIELPNGIYDVIVTVGDPSYSAAYTINVNGQPAIDNEILRKNQFNTASIQVNVNNKKIILDSVCSPKKDCKNSWSRINAINIKKSTAQNQPKSNTDASGATNLGCGNAFIGGRCSNGNDVENCIFDNTMDFNLKQCNGQLHLVKIPLKYECKSQAGRLKCIKNLFDNMDACRQNCPGPCKENKCALPAVKVY